MDEEHHEHDLGLRHDLSALVQRRTALKLLGGAGVAGLAVLAGCGSSNDDATTTSTNAGSSSSSTGSSTTVAAGSSTTAAVDTSTAIPEVTAGPFPGDGTNGPNVLTESGVVRSDITKSFGSASGVAEGVPLTIKLKVLDSTDGGAALAGAAVYVWHCTREGEYSMYGQGVTEENYLRGVQEADADGNVSFTSIYPAAYSGRWPHIHYEVYPSLDEATSAGDPSATSQIALPEDACKLVFATDGYEQSVSNLAQTSLATDNVFSDGWDRELGTVTGTIDGQDLTVSLSVPV